MVDFLLTVLKTIALWFDWIVYELLTYAYALFAAMCRLNFSNLQELLSTVAVRIQVLFGVVMLFIVAFNLLTFIIDPSDKKQTESKLIVKIIVSVGLLVVGNFAFGLLDKLQNAILDENTIEKLVTGTTNVDNYNQPSDEATAEGQYKTFISAGRWISYNLFFSFYTNPDPDDASASGEPDLKKNIMDGEWKFHKIVDHAKDDIRYQYPIVSTFCGFLAIVMYVTFAIDIGVRAFNIMILRVLMPVAAMGYIIPKKGEQILKNYLSTYMITYAQLFAKIFVSYLIVYLMMALMSLLITDVGSGIISGEMITSFNNQNFISSFPIFFRAILLILIFISLYFFYKKLPELIGKILGVKIESGKGLLSKTMGILGGVASLTIGAAAGFMGGMATGIAGGIRGKAGFAGTAKAALHNAGQGLKNKAGTGLTKIGNNTIGEKATGKISNFAKQHNSETRAKNRATTEKYANEHANGRVKEQKAAEARESTAKQKLKEQEAFEKIKGTSNGSSANINNSRIDATKNNTPTPRENVGGPSVIDVYAKDPVEKQREITDTLKRKYQTRQDDELRNQGGQMDSSGTTHAPARNMGAPSVAGGSAFGPIDMNVEQKYKGQQNQNKPQEEKQFKPPIEERKRADELDIDQIKEDQEKENEERAANLENETEAEKTVFEKIENGESVEDAINETHDEITEKQKQQMAENESFNNSKDQFDDEIFDGKFE